MVGVLSRILDVVRPRAAASLDPTDDRWYEPFYGRSSRAGVSVSPETTRSIATAYRCISILANMIAMFPKGMYERLPRGRRDAPDHPLDPLISFKPNKRQTAFEFWQLVCHHLLLRSNAYVQIVPGAPGRGWVGELVPLHPDRVRGPEELDDGRLRYEYFRPNGQRVLMIGGLDIWHLHGLSDDGLKGLSLVDLASDSFGTSIAAERHAARFFERGVKVSGVLQSDKSYKPEVADAMGDSFSRRWGGEQGMARVPVLWEGMKFEPVSMNLKDAEFLDSRKFSVTEIARWFGVPPHMVGDVERSTSWGTGIEQQGLHFLIYSLQPWVEMIEQSIRFTLVVQSDRYYPKFNVNALLRMDAEAQAKVFEHHIKNGILSPNECRELMERNPRPGGDDYVNPAKSSAPPPQTSPEPDPEPPNEDEDEDEDGPDAAARVIEARMAELLEEEAQGLGRLAKRHAKAGSSWRSAVAGFYGRFARRVSDTGICSLERAREWCAARRDLVIENGGLFKFAEGTPASAEALLGGQNAH